MPRPYIGFSSVRSGLVESPQRPPECSRKENGPALSRELPASVGGWVCQSYYFSLSRERPLCMTLMTGLALKVLSDGWALIRAVGRDERKDSFHFHLSRSFGHSLPGMKPRFGMDGDASRKPTESFVNLHFPCPGLLPHHEKYSLGRSPCSYFLILGKSFSSSFASHLK